MRARVSLARIGIAADLVITAIFTAFLLSATSSSGDAVPRPFALAALYGAPGVVAAIGLRTRAMSVVVAASIPLLVGSVIAFSGVTLIFLVPGFLLLLGSEDAVVGSADRHRQQGGRWLRATLVATLLVAAGWSVLFGFAETRCFEVEGGTGCGSGLISMTGVAVGAGLLVAAITTAAWPLLRRRDRP